jgi:ABC-type glycerol-3-phosphate transport system permease component
MQTLHAAIHGFFVKKRNERRQESYYRKNDVLYKRHGAEKVLYVIMFLIFAALAFSYIYPFVWLLINSFKSQSEFATNFSGLPQNWTFDNFINAFTFKSAETNDFTVLQMLGMSVIVSLLGTFATVMVSSCAAYVVAKYDFPGKKIIFGIVIFTLIIPVVGSLPSQIQLMKAMQLNQKIIGLIFLYSGGFGMNFMLLYSFFKNLSWTYVEAAKIDGASDFTIFIHIILPMAKGPIIAISIITLVGLWSDYMTPLIYLPNMPTLAVGLKLLSDAMIQRGNYALLFATIIVSILPVVIGFACFNKTIMKNTAVGGLKG